MKVLSLERLLSDQFRKLAPPSRPIRYQPYTNRDLFPRAFPPSRQFTCFAFLGLLPTGPWDILLRSVVERGALKIKGLLLIGSVLSKYLAIQGEQRICQCNIPQTPVVRSLDNTIHRININPVDNAENFVNTFHWMLIYLLDSVLRLLNNCFQMNTQDLGAKTSYIKNAPYVARISSLLALH